MTSAPDGEVAVDGDRRREPGGRGERVGPLEPHPPPLGVLDARPGPRVRRRARSAAAQEGCVLGQPRASAMGRGAAKTTGVAATTGKVRGSTWARRGSRASTARHCDESGIHVVGAVWVSPSSALPRAAENSWGDALVISVFVQGSPERAIHPVVEVVRVVLEDPGQGGRGADPQVGVAGARAGCRLRPVAVGDEADADRGGHEGDHRDDHDRRASPTRGPAVAPVRRSSGVTGAGRQVLLPSWDECD